MGINYYTKNYQKYKPLSKNEKYCNKFKNSKSLISKANYQFNKFLALIWRSGLKIGPDISYNNLKKKDKSRICVSVWEKVNLIAFDPWIGLGDKPIFGEIRRTHQ